MNIFEIVSGKENKPLIPSRNISAISGSTFCLKHVNSSRTVRQAAILDEICSGNIPDFLRNWKEIKVTDKKNCISYLVSSDYLSIGNDKDYVRMPMNPYTAQKIADRFDCILPTRKMVMDIWNQSDNKLTPLPWGPPYDSSMMSMERIILHNNKIQQQLIGKDYRLLTSGHKKDIIISNELYPDNYKKKVCIFGWIQLNGKPIQNINSFSHEDSYEDYSHGVRLICKDVIVNEKFCRIEDVLLDKELSILLSDEGVVRFIKY